MASCALLILFVNVIFGSSGKEAYLHSHPSSNSHHPHRLVSSMLTPTASLSPCHHCSTEDRCAARRLGEWVNTVRPIIIPDPDFDDTASSTTVELCFTVADTSGTGVGELERVLGGDGVDGAGERCCRGEEAGSVRAACEARKTTSPCSSFEMLSSIAPSDISTAQASSSSSSPAASYVPATGVEASWGARSGNGVVAISLTPR